MEEPLDTAAPPSSTTSGSVSKDTMTSGTPGRAKTACDFCRRRRIRCHPLQDGSACSACQTRNLPCILEHAPSNAAQFQPAEGDLRSLGPLTLLRQQYTSKPSKASDLAARANTISAELKVYREMADYYQNQVARISRESMPQAEQSHLESTKAMQWNNLSHLPNYTMAAIVESITADCRPDVSASSSGEGICSAATPNLPLTLKESAPVVYNSYIASVTAMRQREMAIEIGTMHLEKHYEALLTPLFVVDLRAPEDAHESALTSAVSVLLNDSMSLDSLIELWEHSVVFMSGCWRLHHERATNVFLENAEHLMRVIIFQREAHSMEQYVNRLIRVLTESAAHYRRLCKAGAAMSLLMIAHQIVTNFPASIPPVVRDRVYVMLLMGASTEDARNEWLSMLNDQIHFTASTLTAFNVGCIVSKLRSNPLITPAVYEEVNGRIQQLEALLTSLPPSDKFLLIWRQIIIASFRGELSGRMGDMKRSGEAIQHIQHLIRENYSRDLVERFLIELRCFRSHSAATSALINGKPKVLVDYLIEKVEALQVEMEEKLSSGAHMPSPPPEPPVIAHLLSDSSRAPIFVQQHYQPFAEPAPMPTVDDTYPEWAAEAAAESPSTEIHSPASSSAETGPSATNSWSPFDAYTTADDDILAAWSTSTNRLNEELFGDAGFSDSGLSVP